MDAWRQEYNTDRPHQSLDMATPADRFRPVRRQPTMTLPLWAPADLEPVTSPAAATCGHAGAAAEPVSWPDAVEVDRVVPASGNMTVGAAAVLARPGPRRAAGHLLDRHRHRAPEHRRMADQDRAVPADRRGPGPAAPRRARPAGPPPAGPAPGALAASRCVEVDRLVNATGGITLGNQLILVGSPLAGQRARSASMAR